MLVCLLKSNTIATAPGSSCTNPGGFDSTLFQPCLVGMFPAAAHGGGAVAQENVRAAL